MKQSKKLWQSFTLAMSMYARIPMPMTQWTEESMSYLFCFFPCVGLVCGLGLWMVFYLCKALQLSSFLSAVLCVLVPFAITGGIHLDGFCDTCDALGSHQPREKKLQILKDSHIGAFALMDCVLYLLLDTALWYEAQADPSAVVILCLIPVLSRTLSGLCAVTMKNARGSGLLATFTHASACRVTRFTLALWLVAVAAAMLVCSPLCALGCLFSCGLVLLSYRHMANASFGGITGDLEGWFLQLCELCALAGVVLVQKLEVLL